MRLKQFLIIVMVLLKLVVHCWSKDSGIPPELMKEIKSALLPIFGFKDRPKIDGPIHIPDTMKKLYKMQTEFDMDTNTFPIQHTGNANTLRSFIHVESPVDKRFKNHHHKFRLKFNVNIPNNETLTAATLKITSISSDTEDNYQRILIKDILKPGIKGVDGPITRVLDSKLINTKLNGTFSVDVYPAVTRWLANPKKNFGILVVVYSGKKTKNLRLKRSTEDVKTWAAQQPLLLTFTDDGKYKPRTGKEMLKIRSKRTARRGHRKGDPCRRRQMYVNFRDVGWSDWIVAPLGYHAFYCDGECDYPMPEHMNTTNHAIVQALMNSVRPQDVPKPCCVPTQLSSMSMLYVDSQGKVILKNYKDMVVQGCGCR